jgi:hypothetical protein
MAVYTLLNTIKTTIREWFDRVQGKPKPEHPFIRYGTPILFTLLGVAALSAIYLGYRWYGTHKEQHAQYACSMLIDEYMNLQKQENPDYGNFAVKAENTYMRHKNTAVAPYIGLLAVDAYLYLENHDQAVAIMDKLATQAANNPVTGDLFKVKQALLMIDSADDTKKEGGYKQLEFLADNMENKHRDYALYHLGLYHWNRDNLTAARAVWQELMDTQEVEMRAPSPWAELIAERLSTIPA